MLQRPLLISGTVMWHTTHAISEYRRVAKRKSLLHPVLWTYNSLVIHTCICRLVRIRWINPTRITDIFHSMLLGVAVYSSSLTYCIDYNTSSHGSLNSPLPLFLASALDRCSTTETGADLTFKPMTTQCARGLVEKIQSQGSLFFLSLGGMPPDPP